MVVYSVGSPHGIDPRGLLRGACAPKCCVQFGGAAARASDWRTRSLGAVALGPRAARRGCVLDAAGRHPGEVFQCLRMSILTINLVFSTLVFCIAARIYVLPRLDELACAPGPRGDNFYAGLLPGPGREQAERRLHGLSVRAGTEEAICSPLRSLQCHAITCAADRSAPTDFLRSGPAGGYPARRSRGLRSRRSRCASGPWRHS